MQSCKGLGKGKAKKNRMVEEGCEKGKVGWRNVRCERRRKTRQGKGRTKERKKNETNNQERGRGGKKKKHNSSSDEKYCTVLTNINRC